MTLILDLINLFYLKTDVEGRRLGEQIVLDTLVVQAENYEC